MNDREMTVIQMGDILKFELRPLSDLIAGCRTLGLDPQDLLVTGAAVVRFRETQKATQGEARG